MESSDEIENTEKIKKCFKIQERLQESVKIYYNDSNTMLILWNQYQLFAYELDNLKESSKSFIPEFQTHQIILSNNYLVCLDISGNVHVTSLKFKSSTQKRFKSGFQPKAQNILCLTELNSDTALSLKIESKIIYLCHHRINADFQLVKQTALKCGSSHLMTQTSQDRCIMRCQCVTIANFYMVKELFHTKHELSKDSSLVFISLDRLNAFACLYDPKTEDDISLIEMYSGSSEICDITLEDALSVLIGLKCGTILRIPLTRNCTQEIVHLNSAVYKFIQFKNNLLYTDGISMWKSEDTFSNTDMKIRKLFIKQPKDFVKIADRLICTTYTNMIYSFSMEDQSCYENNEKTEEYCSAERLLKNSELLHKIMAEVDKNEDLIKKVNDESNFITALSLSKRPDIMERIIENKVIVFESYEEVITRHQDITLTEDLQSYFELDIFMFLIKITANLMQQTLNEVLSNLLENTKIHISIYSTEKLLKTTSVKLNEPLTKVKLLIPLKDIHDSTEIKVDTKLILNLPGCLDAKQSVWTVLYRKETILHSEHFIKIPKDFKVDILKEPQERIEELLFKTANIQHGTLYSCTEIPKSDTKECSLYVKLPENFKEVLKNEEFQCNSMQKSNFNEAKAKFLHDQLSSEQFLKSKLKLSFDIGTEKVQLEIMNDFCSPQLKISSEDMKIAFNVRNFLANLVYGNFKDCSPETESVQHTLYTTTENLQKAVKRRLVRGSQEELQSLAQQFYKNIIGAFPI